MLCNFFYLVCLSVCLSVRCCVTLQDGMVVEEMLINDNTMRYLRPGYEVLQRTHDGRSVLGGA